MFEESLRWQGGIRRQQTEGARSGWSSLGNAEASLRITKRAVRGGTVLAGAVGLVVLGSQAQAVAAVGGPARTVPAKAAKAAVGLPWQARGAERVNGWQ
ncbi:hypothetical protein P3T27_002540 [Kitasatospora sp. MAA19]|nr:hypothetical protein [Kitasatospora sp. MAA19]